MIRPQPCATPWPKLLLGLTVCLVVMLLALPARAQPTDLEKALTPTPFGEQTHVFRRLLFNEKYESVEKLDKIKPEETIVVVLGDASKLTELPGGSLSAFLAKGGSVLLATDKPIVPVKLAAEVRDLTGCICPGFHYVYAGRDFTRCYQDEDFCPFAEPVQNPTSKLLFSNPQDHGAPTLKVATNLPALLDMFAVGKPGVQEVARLPVGCVSNDNWGFVANGNTLMVSRQVPGNGRLLLIADHSIFINMMMLPTDNDNVEFTTNCMQWLSEGGKRKKVLFIEEGKIQTQFDVPIKNAPLPTPAGLENAALDYADIQIQKANDKLTNAEYTNRFNTWIHEWLMKQGGTSPWFGVGCLFVLLTLVGLVWGFFRLVVHDFQHQNPIAPSLARLVQHQEPTDSLMEQRNQGMVQVRNFWEIGRQLARQTFEASGIAGKVGDPLPKMQIQGGLLARRQLRRTVTFLWTLAFNKKPLPVRPSQWPSLLQKLEELRRALANGTVRLG